VVGGWGATMCAMAIRDDNSPEELRRRARQEMTAGLPLVCSRLPTSWKGWTAQARRDWPAWTGRPCATGFIATTKRGFVTGPAAGSV
jgi:hypothetical protein